MTGNIDFWEVLEGRRSIRSFTDQAVSRDLIERLLDAGVRAPNAHNNQSWRFVVLTNKAAMVSLANGMRPKYEKALLNSGLTLEEVAVMAEKRRTRLTSAPLAVIPCVVTGDLKTFDDQARTQGEWLMAVQSAALAAGNILLAAHALGLGGVWMCAPMFAPEAVKEAFDLPAGWLAQGVLLIGYPAENPEFRERKPLDEVVKWVS